MAVLPVVTRWTSQPTVATRPSPEFRWDVLINQAFPGHNCATGRQVTPRGSAAVGRGGRWQNWHGVNALEQIAAPLPTTATGYTMLWVGPMQVASTGAGVSIIRTTGGGFRFEPYTTAGGVWMTATHTGVAGLSPPGPWSYSHDSRPWVVLISYDGTNATFEVKTPDGDLASTSTAAGMNDGTGTIDLSTTSGVFGAYLVGYARRPMPAAMRRRLLDLPWLAFEKRNFLTWSAVSGVNLVMQDSTHAHTADGIALTQSHALALADALHGHAADAVTLTQAHALALADALHAHAADSMTLTQAHALALADAVHVHAADGITLTTVGDLVLADALHAHAADGITLTQVHSLAVADALHGHLAEGVTLSLEGQLALADALHGHAADAIDLTQVHVLTVSDALHAHLADLLALSVPGAALLDSNRVLVVQAAGRVLVLRRDSRVLSVPHAARSRTVH